MIRLIDDSNIITGVDMREEGAEDAFGKVYYTYPKIIKPKSEPITQLFMEISFISICKLLFSDHGNDDGMRTIMEMR